MQWLIGAAVLFVSYVVWHWIQTQKHRTEDTIFLDTAPLLRRAIDKLKLVYELPENCDVSIQIEDRRHCRWVWPTEGHYFVVYMSSANGGWKIDLIEVRGNGVAWWYMTPEGQFQFDEGNSTGRPDKKRMPRCVVVFRKDRRPTPAACQA